MVKNDSYRGEQEQEQEQEQEPIIVNWVEKIPVSKELNEINYSFTWTTRGPPLSPSQLSSPPSYKV